MGTATNKNDVSVKVLTICVTYSGALLFVLLQLLLPLFLVMLLHRVATAASHGGVDGVASRKDGERCVVFQCFVFSVCVFCLVLRGRGGGRLFTNFCESRTSHIISDTNVTSKIILHLAHRSKTSKQLHSCNPLWP